MLFREDLLDERLDFNTEISDKGFTEFFVVCSKHINYYAPCK